MNPQCHRRPGKGHDAHMLQTQTAQDKLDDSLYGLERAIQAEAEKQAKAQKDAQEDSESLEG